MKTGFSRLLLIMALLMLAAVGVVSAEEDTEDGHGGAMTTTTLTVGPEVTLRFAATVGGLPATCGILYDGVGTAGSTVSLNDIRFYVSNVRLINEHGEEVAVELEQDGYWQYANVALLDFEDGTSTCSETGTPDLNAKVKGSVPEGVYTGVVFDLGVPFELNHLDTTTAPSPLNIPAMWWNWRAGYKFLRVDMQTPAGQTPQWFAHLGSTGCESPDSNTAPETPCANPNLPEVRLDGYDPLRNFIVADLAGLLSVVNLDESAPQPPGCMGGLEDPDCVGLFAGFGLDLATGASTGEQTFFSVQ